MATSSSTGLSGPGGGSNRADPTMDEQETPIPGARKRISAKGEETANIRMPMGPDAVRKEERKIKKIVLRVVVGSLLFAVFSGIIYAGHLYICIFVAVIEVLLFRELVSVRYSAHFDTIKDQIPFFRTTQWLWYATAIFYTYGDFIHEKLASNEDLHGWLSYAKYFGTVSFLLYSTTFVITISSFEREHIRFQVNQLCWTVVVLALTVGQLKYIMHNIFNGLIWFVLPCCLVVCNDICAWFWGINLGRKFIRRKFISFSPNKTWEGFIFGWFSTMVAAWYVARLLARYKWMTCPVNDFHFSNDKLECDIDPIFQNAQTIVPSQMFELLPRYVVKLIPQIVEICSVKGSDLPDGRVLTPCVSGEPNHQHHHFELVIKNYQPIQVHALYLALFASLVAPFGGFLASAIKRAYGVKDFDTLIPGHGGVMDRFDCQLLMALFTWVWYNTFVKLATLSVPKVVYMYSLLDESEKAEFLNSIMEQGARKLLDRR